MRGRELLCEGYCCRRSRETATEWQGVGHLLRVDEDAPEPPLLRPQLIAQGWSDGELRRRRRSGELVSLCRGAYLVAGDARLSDDVATHALLVESAGPLVAADAVLSHVSAAVLHRLPIWNVPLDRVHRTRARRTGARRTGSTALHAAPLTAGEITEVDGRPVTTLARTLVDLARTLGFEEAVVLVDAALHRHLVSVEALDEALARAAGWPGCPNARRVVAFADRGAMSVGESRSRVAMARFGLPAPVLQWEVTSEVGRLGKVDFAWPEHRVVGEFDGQVKYGKYLRPGQDAGEAVFAEKQREDRIRDEGLRVVRWVWAELRLFAAVADRIRRAHAAR